MPSSIRASFLRFVARNFRLGVLLSLCASWPGSAHGAEPAAPVITVQGVLREDSGALQSGNFRMTFRLYGQPTGGTPLFQQTLEGVPSDGGVFSAHLSGPELTGQLVAETTALWLGLSIEGGPELTPRTQLTAVMRALWADRAKVADSVGGRTAESLQTRITGTCPSGQAIRSVSENGSVSCQPVPTGGAATPTTSAPGQVNLSATAQTVVSRTVTFPEAGTAVVVSQVSFASNSLAPIPVICQLFDGNQPVEAWDWNAGPSNTYWHQSRHTGTTVSKGAHTFRLECEALFGSPSDQVKADPSALLVMYFPTAL